MRLRLAFFLLAAVFALVTSACGSRGGSQLTDSLSVVQRWSEAVNASEDEAAAELFAPGARVIQGGRAVTLAGLDEALRFNASLPCAGTITDTEVDGEKVTATFTLGRRSGHVCEGPGQEAVAVFRVTGGKIVLWHELPARGGTPAESQTA